MDCDLNVTEILSESITSVGSLQIINKRLEGLEKSNKKTDTAGKKEKRRLKRITRREKKFQELPNYDQLKDQLILQYDFEREIPLVSVHEKLVEKLKFHQKEGVKFMWNCCYESVNKIKKSRGSGCILAHCMGLGKTLQVITLVHTVLNNKLTETRTVLICTPKITVLNWTKEFQKWIYGELGSINVFNPTRFERFPDRLQETCKWQTFGGVCVINYELLRILLEEDYSQPKSISPKEKRLFYEYLCDPGPDLIICDEGHLLKNKDTKLSKAMNQIRTLRRIILTGTPLQNNLDEYHCMVNFVKPHLLGTQKEFKNTFVDPILNGQYGNSDLEDVRLMNKRSRALHRKLRGCVQRYDFSTLRSYLPEKREYTIYVGLTECQSQLYRYYLDHFLSKSDTGGNTQICALFTNYQCLSRIWSHPFTLKMYADEYQKEEKDKKKKRDKRVKNDDYDISDLGGHIESISLYWWLQFASADGFDHPGYSGKLVILLKIIEECEKAGEKLLVFSVSIYALKMIEHFLTKLNDPKSYDSGVCSNPPSWKFELDYLLLTGQTSSEDRDKYIKIFNHTDNPRTRLFLISTKAGGIGVNLTAANRAVLFDVSWNPSHDIQSIFRIYRIGQTKPCFIYRLVASGTMEEKIYERQVTKQSTSFRIVDEKQIARHFTERELSELYQFTPEKVHEITTKPKDMLLRTILKEKLENLSGISEHDSLLEDKQEEFQEKKEMGWSNSYKPSDIENLPKREKRMLEKLTPDSFNEKFLKMVLEKEYDKATSSEIDLMMKDLLPRVQSILQRDDFLDVMKKQAVILNKCCLGELSETESDDYDETTDSESSKAESI